MVSMRRREAICLQSIGKQWLGLFFLATWSIGAARSEMPSESVPSDLAEYDALIDDADRQHWSFRPVQRPAVPSVADAGWVRNPIDAFVLSGLEAKGWKPAAAAEPRALLRRIYLDLIGLPPTLAEQDEFLADPTPEAVDRLVDQLLARPAHGERWARHWLDLVRFAESNGYERDAAKPHVWRYRDWVIRALNDDLPFDRFAVQQLAGDELPQADGESLIATGYYRLGPWDDEPADPAEDRFDQLDDIVSTTGQVFLGMTIGCARCHNHKFEPITTLDYYRLVAVFNPLERPQNGRTELDLPAGSAAEIAALGERDWRIGELGQARAEMLAAFREAWLASDATGLPPEVLAAFRTAADQRTPDQQQRVQDHQQSFDEALTAAMPEDTRQRIAALEGEAQRLRESTPDLPRGYFMREPSPDPPATHLLIRGKAAHPGPEVQPGLPVVLASSQPDFSARGERSSLRRTTLARWIANPANPLTARVIVNRVWQFHFGEGLVRTPNDFGVMGESPTHPELLDWLADWFVQEGWSLKKLHRLIAASNTYRVSKAWNREYGEADPEDRLLWRAPYHRLEVEAIRDSILAATGRLNGQMFGPSMYPYVPKEAMAGHSDPDKVWPPFDEQQASRRTIYAFVKRSLIVPMIEVLDFCDTARSTPRRVVTSVAPQALALFNGDFVNRQARYLAERLVREAGPDPARQIELGYLLTLCRPPTEAERAALLDYLEQEAGNLAGESGSGDVHLKSLEQVCRVLFNLNEFVYPD